MNLANIGFLAFWFLQQSNLKLYLNENQAIGITQICLWVLAYNGPYSKLYKALNGFNPIFL